MITFEDLVILGSYAGVNERVNILLLWGILEWTTESYNLENFVGAAMWIYIFFKFKDII